MFEKQFPNLDWWICSHGWVELGGDDYSNSWVRILDGGGTCWEDNSKSLEDALIEAENGLPLKLKIDLVKRLQKLINNL